MVGPLYTSVAQPASLSSGFASPPDGVDIREETLPLLPPKCVPQQTISERWKSTWSSFLDDNFGLFLIAAAELFITGMNTTAKLLNSLDEPVPVIQMLLCRGIVSCVLVFPYLSWKNISNPLLGPKGVRALLVLRGIAGLFGHFGVFFSLQYLSLSDAMVLTFLSPILTGFFGAVFLREPLTLRETLAGLFSFLGVVFISRPQFLFGDPQAISGPSEVTPIQRMLSVAAALIGTLGMSGGFLTLRAIGERAHIFHPIVSFSLQSVLVSALGMILFKIPLVIPTDTLGLALLFLNGIFGFFTQVLLTIGLHYETAGRGALAVYTSIPFALVLEFTIFKTTPSTHSIIGSLMILSSAIHTTLTKKADFKPATDSSPKRSLHGASASDHDGHPGV